MFRRFFIFSFGIFFTLVGTLVAGLQAQATVVAPRIACAASLINQGELYRSLRDKRRDMIHIPRDRNDAFVNWAEAAAKNPTEEIVDPGYIVHLEMIVQKELNEAQRLGFDTTTEVTGYFQDITYELLTKDPRYKDYLAYVDLDRQYADDKTVRLKIKPSGSAELDLQIRSGIPEFTSHVANEFARRMRAVGFDAIVKGSPEVWRGFLDSPDKWIVAGVGDTWREADAAARFARAVSSQGSPGFCDFNLAAFGRVNAEILIQQKLDELSAFRSKLAGRIDLRSRRVLSSHGTSIGLSVETYRIFRAFKPTSRAKYFDELYAEIAKYYNLPKGEFEMQDLMAMHGIYRIIDQFFKPGFLKSSAPPLPPIDRKSGAIVTDFEGIGANNLYETDVAMSEIWFAQQARSKKEAKRNELRAKGAARTPAESELLQTLAVEIATPFRLEKKTIAEGRRAISRADAKLSSKKAAVQKQADDLQPDSTVYFLSDEVLHNLNRNKSLDEIKSWYLDSVYKAKDLSPSAHRTVWISGGFPDHVDLGRLRDLGFEFIKRFKARMREGLTRQETKMIKEERWRKDSPESLQTVMETYVVPPPRLAEYGILVTFAPGAESKPVLRVLVAKPERLNSGEEANISVLYEATQEDMGVQSDFEWGKILSDRDAPMTRDTKRTRD